MSSLKGKVALITGASSGIGAGTGVLFAKLGALLALNGRDEDNLRKVARECTECGAAQVTRGFAAIAAVHTRWPAPRWLVHTLVSSD